jgi:anti-anti-sigma factor
VELGIRTEGSLWFPLSLRRVLRESGSKRAGAKCKAHPFNLESHKRDGTVHLRIGGDFDRVAVRHVKSALATLWGEPLRRVVFDLSAVTFMDVAALTTILRADQRGLREGFEVVVVRPPPPGNRVLILSRAGEHLTIVKDPGEAGVYDQPAARATPSIEFRRLALEDVSTCARCHSNPAVWESGPVVEGPVTLESPEGPICSGCTTKEERIELAEAILGDLRRGQSRDEARIRALEEALTELRDLKPAG